MLEYKGYCGGQEYDQVTKLFCGFISVGHFVIEYEGYNGVGLEASFREGIEGYLADCKKQGITPAKQPKSAHPRQVRAKHLG